MDNGWNDIAQDGVGDIQYTVIFNSIYRRGMSSNTFTHFIM